MGADKRYEGIGDSIMAIGSFCMYDNTKSGRRPKIKGDPADINVSVKLRKSDIDKFNLLPGNDSIGKFLASMIDIYSKVLGGTPKTRDDHQQFGFYDGIGLIGYRIEATDASNFLKAWFAGNATSKIKIAVKGEEEFDHLLAYRNSTPYIKDRWDSNFMETVNYVWNTYCERKFHHLLLYRNYIQELYSKETSGFERENIVSIINRLILMEDDFLDDLTILGPSVRFMAYECWRLNKQHLRPPMPEWANLVADDLIAMNRPCVDWASDHPSGLPK